MPYANKKLRLERLNFENNYSSIAFSEGVFESLKSLTIYVKNKNENNQLFGILLHDERNPQYSMTITAERGNISTEHNSLLLYMQKGTIQRFNRLEKKSEILNFDDYVFNLTENQDLHKKVIRWKPKERFLKELLYPEDGVVALDISKYRAEIQQRLTYPLMSMILAILALSAMLHGSFNRRGNYSNILFATILAILFLTSTISIYRLIETKFYLTLLLYLNFILFFAIAFYGMIYNKSKKE